MNFSILEAAGIPAAIVSALASCVLLFAAVRRFRTGGAGKTGYMAALTGGAGLVGCISYILHQLFPRFASLLPSPLVHMLTALCLTFFFLLLFQEGAKDMPGRALHVCADACAGIRMLMCVTSANNWTGAAILPFWANIRTALLFVLGLTAVSVWFLRRRTHKTVWLAAALTLILCIPPELYGTEPAALYVMRSGSLLCAAWTVLAAEHKG